MIAFLLVSLLHTGHYCGRDTHEWPDDQREKWARDETTGEPGVALRVYLVQRRSGALWWAWWRTTGETRRRCTLPLRKPPMPP